MREKYISINKVLVIVFIFVLFFISCSNNSSNVQKKPKQDSTTLINFIPQKNELSLYSILSMKSFLITQNLNKFDRKKLTKIGCNSFNFNTFKYTTSKSVLFEIFKDKDSDTIRIVQDLRFDEKVLIFYINYNNNQRFLSLNFHYSKQDDIGSLEDGMPSNTPSVIYFDGKKNYFIGIDYVIGNPNCNVSSFMTLNENLYPEFMLKFYRQKKDETTVGLQYKMKIVYGTDNRSLYGEMYSIKQVKKDLNTNISELSGIINSNKILNEQKMIFEIGEHYDKPLWIFNGDHQFKIE